MKLRCCDYAHYYIGSRYRYTWSDGDFVEDVLEAILYNGDVFGCDKSINKKDKEGDNYFEISNIKDQEKGKFQLLLTYPSDMTEVQAQEYKYLCNFCRDSKGHFHKLLNLPQAASPAIHYLIKNGIDAFGLLEFGDAIDKNKDELYLKAEINNSLKFNQLYKIPTNNEHK